MGLSVLCTRPKPRHLPPLCQAADVSGFLLVWFCPCAPAKKSTAFAQPVLLFHAFSPRRCWRGGGITAVVFAPCEGKIGRAGCTRGLGDVRGRRAGVSKAVSRVSRSQSWIWSACWLALLAPPSFLALVCPRRADVASAAEKRDSTMVSRRQLRAPRKAACVCVEFWAGVISPAPPLKLALTTSLAFRPPQTICWGWAEWAHGVVNLVSAVCNHRQLGGASFPSLSWPASQPLGRRVVGLFLLLLLEGGW